VSESIALKTLGLDKTELQDRLIDALCERVLSGQRLPTALRGKLWEAIDLKTDELMATHVAPMVAELLEGLAFQRTNTYGDPTGEKYTLREYIVREAQAWLNKPIDAQGHEQGYANDRTLPRGVRLVRKAIDEAMTAAVADLASAIADSAKGGIEVAITAMKR